MDRRRLIEVAGLLGLTTLAGCLDWDDDGDSGDDTDDSRDDTAETGDDTDDSRDDTPDTGDDSDDVYREVVEGETDADVLGSLVETYYQALDEADGEVIEAITHTDSPQRIFHNWEEVEDIFHAADITLVEVIILQLGDDVAFIQTTYVEVFLGQEQTHTDVLEFRTEHREWKLWNDSGF